VDTYDLFFSYRRAALASAEPLLDALQQAGLRVWRDQAVLPDFAPITDAIREAIASSKALIAFCSPEYFTSRPCQQEFTAAWLAAGRHNARPYDRILAVNPEPIFEHLPKILAEQQLPRWPQDPAGFAALAQMIRARVDSLQDVLGEPEGSAVSRYYGMAPVEARRFVGRVRELWDLNDRLAAHRMGIITGQFGRSVAQVCGLGGSGKSLLAREYAIRFGPAYPGGVFWLRATRDDEDHEVVNAPDPQTLRLDQIRSFAPYVGAKLDGLQAHEVEPEFWRALESRAEPFLWIVDDLPPGLPLEEVERNWIARSSLASTLVTTRSTEYGDAIGASLNLGAISPADALQLLTSQAAPSSEPETRAAAQITADLGYHPLAIDVAGAVLALRVLGFVEYRDALRNSHKDAAELGARLQPALPTGHSPSIAFTLLKSIELLGPEGLDFLCLAAGLADAEIPVSLLRDVFKTADPPDELAERALAALAQADSLCLCSAVGPDARIVHTLISRTIRFHTGMRRRVAELRLTAARALSQALLVLSDVHRRNEVVRELVHARHLMSLDIQPIEALDVGAQVASHDYDLGDYRSALSLSQRVAEARSMRLGPEHPGTLDVLRSLALTMSALGDRAGARNSQTVLVEVCRRCLGGSDRLTQGAINDLALTELQYGNLASASALLEEILQAHAQSRPADDPFLLTVTSNLAGVLVAQGDLPKARQLQEGVLAARLELLGPRHPLALRANDNLATTLQEQGNFDEARRRYDEVLELRRDVLGDNHPDTIMSKDHVARAAQSQGDLDLALKLQTEVFDSRSRLLGESHPDTLKSLTRIAAILEAKGDAAAAEERYRKALEGTIRLVGPDHHEVQNIRSHLANLLSFRGDFHQARDFQENVLAATRNLLGPEHPNTAIAAWNLCQTLLALQDEESARTVFQENLMFLLGRDTATLHPVLRQIQEMAGMPGRSAGA